MELDSHTYRSIIALGCLLTCWTPNAPAGQGREARCVLRNGEIVAGELLTVRDGGVIIRLKSEENETGSVSDEERLKLISRDDLDILIFKAGPDYGTLGALVGAVAGVTLGASVAGALLSGMSGNSQDAVCAQSAGAIVAGMAIACGMIAAGGAIGRSGSDLEEIFRVSDDSDWETLKRYSRFGGNEPPSVRKLFPVP